MVGNITSLTNNGLRDWLIQRVTAVILGVFALYLNFIIFTHPSLDFNQWQVLFHGTCLRIFTTLALISFILHAWIGLWTVSTDYLKCVCLRLSFQMSIVIVSLILLLWGFIVTWGM